jgi:outer membrane protein assembly factor BamA
MMMMNLEYRFPLVDALFLGWPGRIGIGGVGAVAFFDVGSAFDDGFRPFGTTSHGNFQLNDLNADIGFGIRANLGFLPLKFDWAWKTDFVTTGGDAQYTFSIGPDF